MKKKGLIIATIVMVLVLAVSLTTATYAWFSVSSKAEISTISLATMNASDVLVGIEYANTFSTTVDDYRSGTLTDITTNNILGDIGPGPVVDTSINLSGLSYAIGTGTVDATPANSTVDSSWTAGHTIVKARNLADDTAIDPTTIAQATINGDYIDWHLGFQPTKDNIDTITLNITVNPTGASKTTLGLLASLHLRYSIDAGSNYTEVDLYGSQTGHINSKDTLCTAVATPWYTSSAPTNVAVNNNTNNFTNLGEIITAATGETLTDATAINKGAITYSITIGTPDTAFTINAIQQIHLQLYFAGYDSDCVTSALGQSANVFFTVTNTTV